MRFILLILFSLWISHAKAQSVRGKVFESSSSGKQVLAGATLLWINTQVAAVTNENGVFEISSKGITDLRLVAMHVGYLPDTIQIRGQSYVSFLLKADTAALKTVTVKASNPERTEIINEKELTKAACCDLAGCFETQATVQPQTTNVVTNSKELRILGLSGVYNQVLFDGLPMFQGLTYTYGISSYPGTVVGSIYVAKGANSVLQGYEGISGQINVIPKDPGTTDKILLNAYSNNFLESHYNINLADSIGKSKKWTSLLSLHMVQPAQRFDRDGDKFLDLPLLQRYMLYNRWKFGTETQKGISSNIGLRFLHESRLGGQTNFQKSMRGSSRVYGQALEYSQPEFYTKTAYRFNKRHALSLMASSFYQKQSSFFGNVNYEAEQLNFYANIQHDLIWADVHSLKYGLSVRSQDLTELIAIPDTALHRTYAGTYKTRQFVPGVFAENTLSLADGKFMIITGIRLDHHQDFGYKLTPRGLFKYSISSDKTLRISAGTGWRQVNVFSENPNLLASSRDIIFEEKLNAEEGFNWGINYFQKLSKGKFEGSISADFYQTRFSNQFFPDYDSDPSRAYIRNFTGSSVSNAFQLEFNARFNKVIELKTAYNFLDVFREVNRVKTVLPFNPRNRAMLAFSYRPKGDKWYFDLNAHWYDRQRLPNTSSNPVEYRMPAYSKQYSLLNAQVTRKIKAFEIYGGVENIFDFRQKRPITAWQEPFSKYFDTSSVWGPTRGREIYLGIRWRLS